MHNLSKSVKYERVTVDGTNYVLSAGTTDVNSGVVDTQGYEGVAFVAQVGAIAANGAVTVKAQQDTASNMATAADIAGTSQGATADTDDNKLIVVDIYRPQERYVRLAITRGDSGNSTIDSLIAIKYLPQHKPVTQGTDVYGVEVFNSPAEGTA